VDPAEAEATLMRMAEHDVRFENNTVHPDVIDAMLRQPHSDATGPSPTTASAPPRDIPAVGLRPRPRRLRLGRHARRQL
jgi:hypothetical protein